MSLLVERVYATQGNVKDCEMVLRHSELYRKDQDGLSSFVYDYVRLSPGGTLNTKDLTAAFGEYWKQMHGNRPPPGKVILDYIKKLYAGNSSVSFTPPVWRGIQLNNETETMDGI